MELTEEQLRSTLKELVPPVEQSGVLESLVNRGRAARRRHQFSRAAEVVSVVTIIALSALGISWLVRDLPSRSAVQPPVLTPGLVSSTNTPSSLSTAQRQPALTTFTTLQSAPASDAGVTEILAWAEGARARWDSIRVTGAYGTPGRLIAFSLEAAPEGVLCVAGSQTVAVYGNVTWDYDSATNRATKMTKAAMDPSEQAALDQRMAEYAKANPALRRPDEKPVINHPLDDVINPGYWVRTQLGTNAQAVKTLGLETANGRPAFHLSVTFPAETAKEKSWDVYVDQALGIIDRFVINPLPGQEGYEQIVDAASINLQFEPGHFAFSPSSSATVLEAGEPQ